MFAHLQRLHFAYHDDARTGQLMSRANTDLQQIVNFVVMIPLTCANLLTTIGATAMMLRDGLAPHHPRAWAACRCSTCSPSASRRACTPPRWASSGSLPRLAEVVEESVAGVRVVKGFGAESTQADRLQHAAADLYDESMEAARIRARYLPLLDALPNIGLVLVLLYGGHLVIDGGLSLGQLVAFNAYVVLLIWPLAHARQHRRPGAARLGLGGTRRRGPGRRSGDRRARRTRSRSPGTAGASSSPACTSRYPGTTTPVFTELDLTIEAGESVALVGATGSGKSTVAKLIPRFYDVDAGRVALDGVDVRDAALPEVRRAVGIVFEDTFLFSDTIAANIAFADPNASHAEIERAAQLSGAHEFVVELADGYDTEIGERGFSLSGGQRQRIAIARAILADPRVLILDDATSAVDPTKEHEIRDALGEVMRGRTTIVIAHRPGTIALADRVVLLDEGRVAATGTHQELLAGNDRYRAVLAAAQADEQHAASMATSGEVTS